MAESRVRALFAEIITFVVAGIIFEVLYFQVLPQTFAIQTQHLPLQYSLMLWALLVIIIIAIVLRDIKYALTEGFPFTIGVLLVAYYLHDWYSFIIAIVALAIVVFASLYES